MKLDPTVMRTMDRKDFRVLEAVEKGMRNHGIVPGPLVATLANLRHGGSGKIISSLLRDKLLSHETKKGGYDGYRITNAGYDILALHNLKTRGYVAALGDRIGTGKESDVYLAVSKEGQQVVLKFHRLGRTSFRNVRKKRDYFNSKSVASQPNSWLFLSRLSAIKEFAFMKALYGVGYPTPTPLAHSRHVVVMSLVRGVPLYQVMTSQVSPEQAQSIFLQATQMASRLVEHGLVHCDLNEFNLLVDMSGIQSSLVKQEGDDVYVRHSGMSVAGRSRGALSGMGPWGDKQQYGGVPGGEAQIPTMNNQFQYNQLNHHQEENNEDDIPEPVELLDNGKPKPIVTLIDFPQMVSTQHPNAKELYERDLECLRKFFVAKLQCQIPEHDIAKIEQWEKLVGDDNCATTSTEEEGKHSGDDASYAGTSKLNVRLDVELKASGYSVEDSKRDLELFYFQSNEKLMQSTLEEGSDEDEDGNDSEDGNCSNSYGDIEEEEKEEREEAGENKEEVPQHNSAEVENLGNTEEVDAGDEFKSDNEDDQPLVDNLLGSNPLMDMERKKLEDKAKARVRKQLEEQKKKGRRKGAFRSGNSNKNYVKGKRILQDFGL